MHRYADVTSPTSISIGSSIKAILKMAKVFLSMIQDGEALTFHTTGPLKVLSARIIPAVQDIFREA